MTGKNKFTDFDRRSTKEGNLTGLKNETERKTKEGKKISMKECDE